MWRIALKNLEERSLIIVYTKMHVSALLLNKITKNTPLTLAVFGLYHKHKKQFKILTALEIRVCSILKVVIVSFIPLSNVKPSLT